MPMHPLFLRLHNEAAHITNNRFYFQRGLGEPLFFDSLSAVLCGRRIRRFKIKVVKVEVFCCLRFAFLRLESCSVHKV